MTDAAMPPDVALTWPHDQLRDPQQPGRTIDMLRSRDLELPEFHANQLSIANMLAILDLAVLTTRAANAALAARCGELERTLADIQTDARDALFIQIADKARRARYGIKDS